MRDRGTPLHIYCKNCGAPAGFDIINQTYRCTSCGEVTGIQEVRKIVYQWKNLEREKDTVTASGVDMEESTCTSCGARIIFGKQEASEKCMFCGSKLVRSEFTDRSQLPDMIIPFVITPEEAKKRMLDWGHKHQNTPEGKSVVSSMAQFQGSYLPYRIARGPVYAEVHRDGNERRYECGGFIEGTAVNTSKQLDNLVLNDMEPFDWSQARPFEFGYIAGMPVKLNDSSDMEINKRIEEEVTEDFRPEVERVMQTTGVQIKTSTQNIDVLSALLPVYFIKSGKLTAVLNGQTGRIAVSKERTKKSYPWVIEPLIYTVILTCLMGWWMDWDPETVFYSASVFGCIIFAAMSDGRGSLIRRVTIKSETSAAKRQDGELVIDESKDILKNPYDITPVFYENNDKGQKVPVRLRFYTIGRCISVIINALFTVGLPAILAAFLRLATMEDGEAFMDGYDPVLGAAWYMLAVMVVLLYFVKGVRRDAYDHPYIYALYPNGAKRLIGKGRDRKLSVLSMFGVGRVDSNGKSISLFRRLMEMGLLGVVVIISVLFLLLGSTLAILL